MAQPAAPVTATRFPLAHACCRFFQDRFSRRLALAALVSIALTWSLLAFDLWQMQRERVDQAGAQAASLARAVE